MAIMYVLACLVVILANVTAVPDAIGSIFQGAFEAEGVAGGVIGALIVGFQRAAFSNEAGSAPRRSPTPRCKTKHPASEGLVALLEPFIDTVVVCTMTALTIVIANPASWAAAREGNEHRRRHHHLRRLRDRAALVPAPADHRGAAVRLLHDPDLGLLRPEGVDVPLRPQQGQRDRPSR